MHADLWQRSELCRAGRPAPERRCRPRYKAAAARPSRSAELRQCGDRRVVRQRRHHGECRPRLLPPSCPASAPRTGLGSPWLPGRALPGTHKCGQLATGVPAVLALPLPGFSLFLSRSLPGSRQPAGFEHPLVPVARRPPASPAACGHRRSGGHAAHHSPTFNSVGSCPCPAVPSPAAGSSPHPKVASFTHCPAPRVGITVGGLPGCPAAVVLRRSLAHELSSCSGEHPSPKVSRAPSLLSAEPCFQPFLCHTLS